MVLQTGRPPAGPAKAAWKEVAEIDPSSPRWYEKLGRLSEARLAKAHLPRLWKSPLGNDCLRPRRHVLGELAELRPDADARNVSWQAFWLPISQPGRPHLLEVDYPSDVAQTLGIAIVEPNAAGVMTPMTIGSGIDNSAEPIGGDPRWRQHRLIFWPRTASPLVLLTNAEARRHGAVRQVAGLLRESGCRRRAGRRETGVCWRPISTVPCSPRFSPRPRAWTPGAAAASTIRRTFYEAGTRLVDYLNHVGYNGLMIGVAANGSAIYPSAALEPTRATIAAFSSPPARTPSQDTLEMLLRLFDREGLRLIPMVEFASPLPELEAVCRAGASRRAWNGSARTAPTGARGRRGGDWRRITTCSIRACRKRCCACCTSWHRATPDTRPWPAWPCGSRPNGYAQLPGPEWGLDNDTMARFAAATNLQLPARGPPAIRRARQRWPASRSGGRGWRGGPSNWAASTAAPAKS